MCEDFCIYTGLDLAVNTIFLCKFKYIIFSYVNNNTKYRP